MLSHLIDFVFDYFSNLNTKKIIGGILVLIGLALVQEIQTAEDLNRGVLYLCGSIIISGIGTVIIYHDIARDKAGTTQNDLELIAKAYELKEKEDKTTTETKVDENKTTPFR